MGKAGEGRTRVSIVGAVVVERADTEVRPYRQPT